MASCGRGGGGEDAGGGLYMFVDVYGRSTERAPIIIRKTKVTRYRENK
jgi:hypothetical protein